MKNPLLTSFLIVVLTWYWILALPTPALLHEIPVKLLDGIWVVLIGACWGGGAYFLWLVVRRGNTQQALKTGGAKRGLSISLGPFPPSAAPPKRRNIKHEEIPHKVRDWLQSYGSKHPNHARLASALVQVYAAHSTLPASPVPGGHGGATLEQHTFNVLTTILSMAPSWRYEGHRNRKGHIVFPLIDGTYRFDTSDPLIPLAGLAHDIGKISCYRLREDGLVDEVRPNHDTEGGRILVTMEEFWALPRADRDSLNLAVSFYHHINSLPLWADDRTRALTELLIAADIRTGTAEGEGNMAALYEEIDSLPAWLSLPSTDDPETTGAQTFSSEETELEARLDTARHQTTVKAADTNNVRAQQSCPVDENEEWVWNQFESLVLEPGRINGNDKSSRIGFKHGDWLYVSDALLRTALSLSLNAPRLTEQPGRGQMAPVTQLLLSRLARLGYLYQDHGGLHFSPKSALFKMVMHGTGGKIVQNWGFTIIFRAVAFPALQAMADCKYAPNVLGCGFGDHRAKDKNQIASEDALIENIDPSGNVRDALFSLLDLAMNDANEDLFKRRKDTRGEWACIALHKLQDTLPITRGWQVGSPILESDITARWTQGSSGMYLCLLMKSTEVGHDN